MAKNIEIYKLGVVLNVEGAKGLSTLKAADSELSKVDKSGKRAEGTLGKVAGALNRVSNALKGNAGGAGSGGLLPGLAHISNIIQGLPQIGQLAGALVSPLTNAAEAGVKFNAFLETTEIALKRHFGGSREEARKFVGEVRDFAGKSPFRTEGLIRTVIYGTATGFSPREALKLVRDVGDAIASTGDISEETVEGVVRALSQMKAKGTVSAEEMEQLAERGIPAWEMLAHAIGKTVAETRKASEQGKLNGPAAVAALRVEMRARYGGMMDELQSTLTGRISALEDATQAAQARATESLTNDISESVAAGLNRAGLIDSLAGTINSAIAPVSGLIRTAAVGVLGGGITSGLAEGIRAGKGMVTAAVGEFALDSVISPFKRLLGINSPSTVFSEFGDNVGEGFQIGALAALDEAQKAIVNKIVEIGRAAGATTDEIKAALATAWVESKFRNLRHGDRDSLGVFQQRPSQGWGTPSQVLDPDYAARKFYGEAMRRRGRGLSPGALAQSVQRSGYPDRYEEALPFINGLIRNLGEGSGIEPTRVRRAWEVLAEFARMQGFTVTSTTGGRHNKGSLHGRGLAVDVRTRDKSPQEVAGFIEEARAAGISVRDERKRPAGQAVWGGPHLHLSLPNGLVSTANPLPVVGVGVSASLNFGGASDTFNPAAAPQVLARAQQDLGRTIRDTGTTVVEVNQELGGLTTIAHQVAGVEALHFYAEQRLTQATARQELAAGHAATSVLQLAKSAESTGQKLLGMLAGLGGLMPQQQVGKKRGFFSKMLGFAAPFLNFIPGVGPILSTLASIGSSALGGDWGGALAAGLGGLAPGGAFRRSGASTATAATANTGSAITNSFQQFGTLPGRVSGGPVSRGRAYMVGELRPEVFTPDEDGWIHPSVDSFGRSRAARAGGGAGGGEPGGFWPAAVERLTQVLERYESMSPEHVLVNGARTSGGARAVADGYQRHASRSPSAVEFMQRRMMNQ